MFLQENAIYSWTSTINANSFNLTVEEFYNEKNATLNATNNFNVTALIVALPYQLYNLLLQ